jgi:DNA integrity scanning protein DisA with diadenylate cyclase activity
MKEFSKEIIESAFRIGKKIGANFILINADILKKSGEIPEYLLKKENIILLTKDIDELKEIDKKRIISLPKADIPKMSQIKFAIISGVSTGILNKEWIIIFITGDSFLDTIMIININEEADNIKLFNFDNNVKPEVFLAILNLSIELAAHGKDGKPVGTIFVLGDKKVVLKLSKQMIINPFKGYSKIERDLLNPYLKETIKEFSSIDGAFIIGEDGLVITAGRYLNAPFKKFLPLGLGSRHRAAAGITAKSKAIAITISESTGTIRIFKNGEIVGEIERY